jgi:hypothetical protein
MFMRSTSLWHVCKTPPSNSTRHSLWKSVLMRGTPLSQLSSRSSSVSRLFWLRASSFFSAYSLHTRSLSMNSLSHGWMYLQYNK